MSGQRPSAADASGDSDPVVGGAVAESRGEFDSEQQGYRKGLTRRHMEMIALGGAIGTGLFMAAGGSLHDVGPILVLVYVVCGFFVFLILRALGELVLHRPSSGSFVSYAREFLGEKAAFLAGWMYFLVWATGAVADSTAVALYFHYWSAFSAVPQWLIALLAIVVVFGVNLVSVRLFGELEFWFAFIKVSALAIFLLIGIVFLATGASTADGPTGLALLAANGGIAPVGVLPAVIVFGGVIFAFAAVELVGTAAGETQNPEKVIPGAINTVILRISLFYVGSILLLSLLLPYTVYSANESPFVTFFTGAWGPQVGAVTGSVMNFVVITAAISSLNAGLYSTGRILHSMSLNGASPHFTQLMNRRGVPYGGMLLTLGVGILGVALNYLAPSQAFSIILNLSAIGTLSTWTFIVLCQMRLRRWAMQGRAERPAFRLFGTPFTSYLTLAFLATVLVLFALNNPPIEEWSPTNLPIGLLTVGSLVVILPLIAAGWFLSRHRIAQAISDRQEND